MKKISVSAVAFALAMAASAAHADTTPGWYVGAGVGGVFGQDPIMHSVTGEHSARDEDINVDVLANAGYAYGNGWRLEGEYFHDQVNVNNIDSQPGAGGHVSNNALFANVLYDFQTNSRWTPYLGAGIGPDFVNVKSPGASGVGYLQGDTLVMGYQGIAGLSTHLDKNWDFTADYRYISSFDPKVDSTAGGRGRIENASHNVIVGVRYNFAAPEAPVEQQPMQMRQAYAPNVSAKAPAHAVVGESSQNFMVFFDFDKSTITPEAKRIIASAAEAFKRNGYAAIQVTGHTDTSGSAHYNQKLSERRAAAVEAELARDGVSTSNIKEVGVGENGLMVPTADGVREAQNRRAEIVLSK